MCTAGNHVCHSMHQCLACTRGFNVFLVKNVLYIYVMYIHVHLIIVHVGTITECDTPYNHPLLGIRSHYILYTCVPQDETTNASSTPTQQESSTDVQDTPSTNQDISAANDQIISTSGQRRSTSSH